MSDQKTNMTALYFPKELSLSDTNCVVCLSDAKNPVFCTTCKKMFCCDCMVKCQQSNGCAICRNKTTIEVYLAQSERYRCEKHELLITMLCKECDICVCKQCLGRESEHSLHAFITIDDIREELCREVEKIYAYKNILDSLQGIISVSDHASRFAEKCFINIKSFGAILKSIEETIGTFIAEINTYDLKDLIINRDRLKNQVQDTLDEISTLERQEPQQIYDFESLFEIQIPTYRTKVADDKYGNQWCLKLHQTPQNIVFYLKFLCGTPGRYEIKIDSSNKSLEFQKVVMFKNFSQKFKLYKTRLTAVNVQDLRLTVGLRPTNFKYHLQCTKVYRELVNDLLASPYSEKKILIAEEMLQTQKSEFFMKDGTGTTWRLKCSILNEGEISYLSVSLEHYDGAVGRYEFYMQLTNQNDETKPAELSHSRRFSFGSEYRVKKFVVLSNHSECFFDLQRGVQLIIGIRPTTKKLSYLHRFLNIFS